MGYIVAVIRSCEPHGIASNAPEVDMRRFAGFCLMLRLDRNE
jgi:hypothetical protein